VGLAPGREGLPAERHDDLLAPSLLVRVEPFLPNSKALRVESKLPRPVQIDPIVSLDGAAPEVRTRILRPWISSQVYHSFLSPIGARRSSHPRRSNSFGLKYVRNPASERAAA